LADCYEDLGIWGALPPPEASSKAKAAAQKALSIDPNLGEAHATLAHLHFAYDWDWAGAQQEFDRAMQLNPRSSDVLLRYATYLAAMGKKDSAIEQIKAAHELDPVSRPTNTILGFIYLLVREYDDAIAQLKKTLALYPDSSVDHYNLGVSYEHKGRFAEAVEEFQKSDEVEGASKEELAFKRRAFLTNGFRGYLEWQLRSDIVESRTHYVPPFDFADLYARLGDKDRAFENLEKAYAERGHNLAFIKVEPGLDSIRSDPRYAELLGRMGLRQ
jgi:tetratricopeptide (TPR) repeat protein